MLRGVANGLANKVFALQKTTGAVPGNVMAAARMVKQGSASDADVNTLRGYLGISSSGATAAKSQLSVIRKSFGLAAHLGVLADVSERGGVAGGLATLQIGNIGAQKLEQLVQSPQFQTVLTKAVGTNIGRFMTGGNPADSTELAGIKAGYAMRRGARMVGAAVTVAGLAVETMRTLSGYQDASGNEHTAEYRIAKTNRDLMLADHTASYGQRKIAEAERRIAFLSDTFDWNPFGGYFKKKEREKEGISVEQVGLMKAREAARASSLGIDTHEAYQIHRDAQNEAFRGAGGNIARSFYELGFGRDAIEAKTSEIELARIKEMEERFASGYELADKREFGEADAHFNAAGRAWMDPELIWKNQVVGRGAVRLWAAKNMTRAAMRTGD